MTSLLCRSVYVVQMTATTIELHVVSLQFAQLRTLVYFLVVFVFLNFEPRRAGEIQFYRKKSTSAFRLSVYGRCYRVFQIPVPNLIIFAFFFFHSRIFSRPAEIRVRDRWMVDGRLSQHTAAARLLTCVLHTLWCACRFRLCPMHAVRNPDFDAQLTRCFARCFRDGYHLYRLR